jgi:hypothetical protein
MIHCTTSGSRRPFHFKTVVTEVKRLQTYSGYVFPFTRIIILAATATDQQWCYLRISPSGISVLAVVLPFSCWTTAPCLVAAAAESRSFIFPLRKVHVSSSFSLSLFFPSFFSFRELLDDPNEEYVDKVAGMLGAKRVGFIFAHPTRSRDMIFRSNEIISCAEAQLIGTDGDTKSPFVTVKVVTLSVLSVFILPVAILSRCYSVRYASIRYESVRLHSARCHSVSYLSVLLSVLNLSVVILSVINYFSFFLFFFCLLSFCPLSFCPL